MNKFTKRLLALGLALSIVVGIGSVSVFADSGKVTGTLNGNRTVGTYSIERYGAKAGTSYAGNGSAIISSNYGYANLVTLNYRSMSKSARNNKSASVNFKAPQYCISIQMRNTHTVIASGKIWEKSYLATY